MIARANVIGTMPLDLLNQLPRGIGRRLSAFNGHTMAPLEQSATQINAMVLSAKAAAENAADAAVSAAAAVAGRTARSTSFVEVTSSEIGPGEHLLPQNYHPSVAGGTAKIPQLRIVSAPKGTETFVVVAEDVDDPQSATLESPWGPGKVIWVRVNIPIQASDELGGRNSGWDVLPYAGTWVNDDFIHRIYWRIFALKGWIPHHIFEQGWPAVYKFLQRRDFFKHEMHHGDLSGDKGEFMTLAVRRQPGGFTSASAPESDDYNRTAQNSRAPAQVDEF